MLRDRGLRVLSLVALAAAALAGPAAAVARAQGWWWEGGRLEPGAAEASGLLPDGSRPSPAGKVELVEVQVEGDRARGKYG